MHTIADNNPLILTAQVPSRRETLLGRGLSTLAVLFLIFDTTGKLLQVQPVIDGTVRLGYSPDIVVTLGVLQLACLVTYLIPRTSLLGAVLLTGYLGGAVATHVRVDSPLFSHILVPIYVATLLWGGLVLRDARLRALVLRRSS